MLKFGGGAVIIGQNSNLSNSTISAWNGSKVVIGKNCTVTGGIKVHAFEGKSVHIGEDCLISEARIRTSDMHSLIDLSTGERFNQADDIVIGNHVLIFEDVYIGKGVTIGDNSVCATRSVVVKSVPSNCVVGGVPAKVIKTNITWDKKLI